MRVDKVTLRWPYTLSDGGANTYGLGMPNPSTPGAWALINAVGNVSAFPDPNITTATDKSYQRVLIPSGLTLRAVAIAPDSPIACCNISFGNSQSDKTTHRISPGNPFIGEINEGSFAVSLPKGAAPALPISAGANFSFDAVPILGINTAYPLRLVLYYDNAPVFLNQSDRRPPYWGKCRFLLGAAQAGIFSMCVDGRRRLVVITTVGTATASMIVEEREPLIGNTTTTIESGGKITELFNGALGATQERRDFSVSLGRFLPIWEVRVTISDAVGTGTAVTNGHYVDVIAYDE